MIREPLDSDSGGVWTENQNRSSCTQKQADPHPHPTPSSAGKVLQGHGWLWVPACHPCFVSSLPTLPFTLTLLGPSCDLTVQCGFPLLLGRWRAGFCCCLRLNHEHEEPTARGDPSPSTVPSACGQVRWLTQLQTPRLWSGWTPIPADTGRPSELIRAPGSVAWSARPGSACWKADSSVWKGGPWAMGIDKWLHACL